MSIEPQRFILTWLAPALTSGTRTIRAQGPVNTENLTLSLTGGHDAGARYWGYGAGSNPSLGLALATALATHTDIATATHSYDHASAPGHPRTVYTLDEPLSLLWEHANTTLDPLLFGFAGTDTPSGDEIYSDFNGGAYWHPNTVARRYRPDYTPVSYGARSPLYPANHTRVRWHGVSEGVKMHRVTWEYVDFAYLMTDFAQDSVYAAAGGRVPADTNNTLQNLIDAVADGEEMRLYLTPTEYVTVICDEMGPVGVGDVSSEGGIPGKSTVSLVLAEVAGLTDGAP